MALDSGSASFRMLELPRKFPADWPKRFAQHAAGSLDSVTDAESTGWVTGRHLLDSHITAGTAIQAGYVHLVMRIAQRKIPPTLLRAECKLEELAVMAADGKPFLRAQERADIKKSVAERLLPKMPPQLKAIPFIHSLDETYLFAGATNEKQTDQLAGLLAATLGMAPEPCDPVSLALAMRHVDANALPGASFSPEMPDADMEPVLGREFLTWLWFNADSHNGMVSLADGRDLGILLEGPLTFVNEGNGAFYTTLRKGEPESSMEAKTSLLAGKKLASAKLTMALDEERVWAFNLDADLFAFRAMKLPRSEAGDPVTRFQDRMASLAEWRALWLDLYGQFLDLRTTPAKWNKTVRKIREWVAGRPARR